MTSALRAASICLAIALAAANLATGAEVLVSTPEELTAAIAASRPGETLVVQNGVYPDWRVSFQAAGTAANPTTCRAQTPGGVKFTGNARLEISGSCLVVSGFLFEDARSTRHASIVEFRGAHYCRLTDCSFVRCGDPESTYTRTVNLAYGSSHNRVDHCFMTGTLSMGMGVVVRDGDGGSGNTDNRFDHNYFKDIQRLSSNGQEPIQLGQDQTAFGHVSVRALVEDNLFQNASGDSEIISNKSADNVIRGNTMRDSKAGICLRGGRNVLVEGNYCLRTRGIRVYGHGHTVINNYLEETEDGICLDAGQYRDGQFVDRETSGSYQAASAVLVAHNTIVGPTDSGIGLGRDRGRTHGGVLKNELPHQIRFVNNLLTGTRGVLIRDDGSRDVTWQTNIAWPGPQAKPGLSNRGIIEIDPRLARDDGIRYRPDSHSPARDAGTILPEVVADYSGRQRVGSPDIGCDEVSHAAVANRPLGPEDVGPSWNRERREGP
jgi:poly(beta-D-mannuronate) lyase